VPSLIFCLLDIHWLYNVSQLFIVECDIARFLCTWLLCVYSTFGHHPHSSPLGYLGPKFRFCRAPVCWASLRRKITYSTNHSLSHSLTQSLTQLIWFAGNRNFRFGTSEIEIKLFHPLKLFRNYFSDIEHVVKYSWAAISFWDSFEIILFHM